MEQVKAEPVAWMYGINAYTYQLPDWSPAKALEVPLYATPQPAAVDEQYAQALSAYLWNRIGDRTNAVAAKFGVNGWYEIVCQALAQIERKPENVNG